MNPEKDPPKAREELEMRLTALLLSELPPEEAAKLQAQMSADPGLAALHTRLGKAMALLREATSIPEQAAPATPVQMSSERRERLLAHFKTTAPAATSAPEPTPIVRETPRRDWSWAVPLGLAAGLVALLGVGVLMPRFSSVQSQAVFSQVDVRNAGTIQRGTAGQPISTGEVTVHGTGSWDLGAAKFPSATPAPSPQFDPIAIVLPGAASYWETSPGAHVATASTPGLSLGDIPAEEKRPFGTDVASGAWTLNGANTFTGGTTAPGGGGLALCQLLQNEFQRYPGQTAGTSPGFANGSTFAGTINGNISGTLNVDSGTIATANGTSAAGNGTLTLAGTNTYGGATTISGGTLTFGGTSSFISGGGLVKSGAGTLAIGSNIDDINGNSAAKAAPAEPVTDDAGEISISSVTSTSGNTASSVTMNGGGSLTLQGGNPVASVGAFSGVFSDPQFQIVTRGQNQEQDVNVPLLPGGKLVASNPSGSESLTSSGTTQGRRTFTRREIGSDTEPGAQLLAPTPSAPAIGMPAPAAPAAPAEMAKLDSAEKKSPLADAPKLAAARSPIVTQGDRETTPANPVEHTKFRGAHRPLIVDQESQAGTPTPNPSPDAPALTLEQADTHAAAGGINLLPNQILLPAATPAPAEAQMARLNAAGNTRTKDKMIRPDNTPQPRPISVDSIDSLMLPASPGITVDAKTPEAAIEAGKAAMKNRDYEKATAYFQRASDLIPDTPDNRSRRKEAVDKFSDAGLKLATQLITEGRYQVAQETLTSVLDEHHDPRNKKAITLLSHLEQPDYFNKTITPEFRGNVEQEKQWFIEAQGLYDTGRLDLAKQRCEHILDVDPYNRAAREFEEKIEHTRDEYGIAAYNHTRSKQVADVTNEWAMPVRKFNQEAQSTDTNPTDAAHAQAIRQKLERIIIPKLEFREATVREAIDFLKKKSVELDGESPAGEKGANIVLKLGDSATEGTASPAAPQAAAGATGSPADTRITVSLTNIPLIDALKYVTGLANLKYKVEPYAVSVVPLTEPPPAIVTKEWKIPPDLLPPKTEDGGANRKGAVADRETAKNWLLAQGVVFNGPASAVYVPKSSRLIVRNTPDQIDLVDTIVTAGIETKAAIAKMKQESSAKPTAPSPLIPQPEIQTSDNAFSTFSLNVSDVSFKLAAAGLEQGRMPDVSTVRSEEFINAFDYRDPEPAPGAPLAFTAERARDPFAQNRDLLRFSVKTAAAGRQQGRPLNIVLLLDKSGSMERADRVNIVREALRVLAAQLQPQDQLSIVTFARTPRLWADGVAGDKAGELIARVSEITPEGGTNLEAALDLGYDTALRHYAAASINRVVLFTDGAANLGDVDPEALTKKVEAKRKQGVALDCFGIGWEGYNDDLLEQLTRNGDGRYGFINTPEEATANFAAQLAGALQVAASDVKVQIEFNPQRVTAYRQIGYAKHQLTKEQFRDNSVAAAQIGAAESGNALYVVAVDPKGEGDLATVRVRYRVPGTSDYREHEWVVSYAGNIPPLEQASPALRLAGTAAAFSEMLAASPYAADVTSDRLLSLLEGVPAIYGADPRPQKLEWMIRTAKSLTGR